MNTGTPTETTPIAPPTTSRATMSSGADCATAVQAQPAANGTCRDDVSCKDLVS